jgi:hypothetical protein
MDTQYINSPLYMDHIQNKGHEAEQKNLSP